MKQWFFNIIAGVLGKAIGRNNLVRYGNFISRAGRLDFPNGLKNNGELLVQKVALSGSEEIPIIIVDCGANIGEWTDELCKQAATRNDLGNIEIYSFEPSKFTYKELLITVKNIYADDNIKIFPINSALSSHSGEGQLSIIHPGAGTNSLVQTETKDADSKENVKLLTLDNFAEKNNLSYISLLKIDAEGHDPDVIKGAENLISNQKIGIIQFEYNWRWIFSNQFLRNVFADLSKQGYCIGKVTPKGIQFFPEYHIDLETFVEGNYIACLKKWVNKFPKVDYWRLIK